MIDAPNARFGLAGTLDNHKVLGTYLPTLVLDVLDGNLHVLNL